MFKLDQAALDLRCLVALRLFLLKPAIRLPVQKSLSEGSLLISESLPFNRMPERDANHFLRYGSLRHFLVCPSTIWYTGGKGQIFTHRDNGSFCNKLNLIEDVARQMPFR